MEPKYIAQGLAETWKKEKLKDSENNKVAPLMRFLEFNYNERYVALCYRLNITPVSLGKWLRKEIKDVV